MREVRGRGGFREASRHGGEEEKRKNKKQKIDGETRVSGSHRCPPQSQKLQSRGPKGQCSSCSLTKGQEDGAALNAGEKLGGGWEVGQPGALGTARLWGGRGHQVGRWESGPSKGRG